MAAVGPRWDRSLFLGFFLISVLGIFFIHSATWAPQDAEPVLSRLVIRQSIWVAIGMVIALLIARIEHLKLVDMGYFLYVINLLALLLVLFIGQERYGARRWISIGGVSVQPSEFIKITAILALASFLGNKKHSTGSLLNFLGAAVLVMPSFLLIFMQPDLGTALVLVPITLAVLYLAGERIKYICGFVLAGLASVPFLWQFLKSYQRQRLLVFINPDLDPLGAGYTIIQSKIALGSGGIWGKGYLEGTQSYLRFLPERHTDFIFSVVGEQWGFIGGALLISLFGFVFWRGIRAMQKCPDLHGRVIAGGVISLLFFQVFVNISMTMGLMPVVGLPLPGVSYGGSSIVASFVCVGILMSVSSSAR